MALKSYPHNRFKTGDKVRIVRFKDMIHDVRKKYLNLIGIIGKVNDYPGSYPYQVIIQDNKRTSGSDGYRYKQSEIELVGPRKIDNDGNLM